jgi:hypothetical protein
VSKKLIKQNHLIEQELKKSMFELIDSEILWTARFKNNSFI